MSNRLVLYKKDFIGSRDHHGSFYYLRAEDVHKPMGHTAPTINARSIFELADIMVEKVITSARDGYFWNIKNASEITTIPASRRVLRGQHYLDKKVSAEEILLLEKDYKEKYEKWRQAANARAAS